MFKLSDQQYIECRNAFLVSNGDQPISQCDLPVLHSLKRGDLTMFDKFQEIIQNSKTHRIVGVPTGYEWHNTNAPVVDLDPYKGCPNVRFQFNLISIAKPVPAPDLSPRTVTVERMYPAGYTIPNGYEARFASVEELFKAGFNHYLQITTECVASHMAPLSTSHSKTWHVIGLKKWNG